MPSSKVCRTCSESASSPLGLLKAVSRRQSGEAGLQCAHAACCRWCSLRTSGHGSRLAADLEDLCMALGARRHSVPSSKVNRMQSESAPRPLAALTVQSMTDTLCGLDATGL